MAHTIILPKLGFSMEEGTLAEWLVADGAEVSQGDPLYVIESDKSSQEVESPASGKLRVIAETGETYPVGTTLGEIG